MTIRLFDFLLRLFPAAFRGRHAEDMRDAFARGCEDHRVRGRLSLLGFLARTMLDLITSGSRARLAPARGTGSGYGGGSQSIFSMLDVKLGVRMLVKRPGLTLVSTFALAVGIPVGLAPAHFVDGVMAPLPVPEGHRIRALRLWNPMQGRPEQPTRLEYEAWRSALSSFKEVAAFRKTSFNVASGVGAGPAVRGAEMTATAFEITRIRPLVGRYVQPADEEPGAEPVVVLGHDLWQARFAGDLSIVGRSIFLGNTRHTVVGVMPEGFLFPERHHAWTALRVTTAEGLEGSMPLTVFGRLADGVADEHGRTEFALVAGRSVHRNADDRLRGEVTAFASTVMPGLHGGNLRTTPEYLAFQAIALMVLLVACANVGMLVFARTTTRAAELAVRTALGASRARIVAQVFTECLVLAVLATGAGLVLMAGVLELVWAVLPDRAAAVLPYWIDWSVTGRTALRALALAGLSAAVAGAVPALRFTSESVQANIRRARAGRTGLRFGGVPGVLIVLDVAVAVAGVGFAVAASELVREVGTSRDVVGIQAEEYLAAEISLPANPVAGGGAGETAERASRMAATQRDLVRALESEPGVRGVAVADYLPRMEHYPRRVEVEGVAPPEGRTGVSARTNRVDVAFFESLGQPILQGRGFDSGDLGEDRSVVIVNTSFVKHMLGGQNALGRRIRYRPRGDGEPGPWKEIVGVIGPLGMRVASPNDWGVYEPFAPGELATVRLAIHVGGEPAAFAPRLRAVAAGVDAEAIVSVIGPLDGVHEGDWYILLAAMAGGALLVGVLLALAASGIYALLSFAVTERTTEIGIRAALGAGRADLVRSVAKRAVAQIGIGVLLGMPLALLFMSGGDRTALEGAGKALATGIAVMIVVGLTACTGPTLRALRVQPGEALRSGG